MYNNLYYTTGFYYLNIPKRENHNTYILALCSKVLLKIFLNMLFTDMVQYLKSFEEPVSYIVSKLKISVIFY